MHHRSHRERCLSTTTWPTWMLSSSDASRRPIALHAHRAPEADFTMRGRGRCRLASLKPFACGERVTSFGKCFLRISGLNAAIRALSSPCAREGSQPNAPRSAPNSRDARAHASRSGGCAPRPSRRTRRLQIAYSKCQRGLEAELWHRGRWRCRAHLNQPQQTVASIRKPMCWHVQVNGILIQP